MKISAAYKNILRTSAAIASAITPIVVPAHAQVADASDVSGSEVNDGVNVILVTARKREESTQDVATSIRVFSGEQAAELGIDQPLDVARQTPGLNAKYAIGSENPVFTMRGVGLNDYSAINNPTVGVYVDDIFVPYLPMMGGQLYDIDRIEVLKGPQGSLYGRNTTGGAIKFISRGPTDYLDVDARVDYSSWQTLEAEAGIGGPLTDTVRGRVAVSSTQRQGGYLFNRFTGETVGKQSRFAGRAILEFEPTEAFSAQLNVHGYSNRADATIREHIGFVDPVTGKRTCSAVLNGERGGCTDLSGYVDNDGDPYTSDANFLYGDQVNSKSWGSSLTLNYDTPLGTITSITGYDRFKRNLVDDNDSSPNIAFEFDVTDKIEVFSQEFRTVSNPESAIKYVFGVFFSWDNVDSQSEQAVDKLFNTRVGVSHDQTTKSYAGFGNVEIPLGEQFSINGGLRLTYEKKSDRSISQDFATLGPISALNPTRGPFIFSDKSMTIDQTDLSGNIGIQFKPNSDVMIYANASKGFKSGGFKGNISFNPAQVEPYGPENLYAYEVGLKSVLFNRKLMFNAALYYYDWRDFQAYSLVQLAVPVVVLTNAGDAEVKGVEAEVVWQPSRQFSLSAAVNYLDAKIVKFNALSGGQNNLGNKLANAPDFTFSGIANYKFPIIGDNIEPFVQLQANYQSKVFFEIQNNPINSEDSYWLIGARVGADIDDGRWNVAAYVRNLFDKEYVAESRYVDLRTFPSSNLYGEPRSFGFAVSYKY